MISERAGLVRAIRCTAHGLGWFMR